MKIGKVNLKGSNCSYTYQWVLDGSHVKSKDYVISSPIFYTYYDRKIIKWHLNAYRKDSRSLSRSFILCNINSRSITASVELTVWSKGKSLMNKYTPVTKVFKPYEEHAFSLLKSHTHECITLSIIGNSRSLKNTEADDHLIECTINIKSIDQSLSEGPSNHTFGSDDIIQSDLGKLFDKNNVTDIILRTSDDQELAVHKCILAARSSVFDRMFNNEMRESCTNVVIIDNIPHKILKELVRYIYTEKVEQIDDIAVDLLKAANMYDISGLIAECEEALLTRLNADNVMDYLRMADDHNAIQLKDRSIEFIASNFVATKMRTLESLSSSLLAAILRSVALKMKSSSLIQLN